MTSEHLYCVDLFSGAGGLSKGFEDAGFEVILGVDHDDDALATFKLNHKKSTAMNVDLFDHNNISIITDFVKNKTDELDVLIGGPPCQGFSIAGPRKEDDPRNTLYTAMVLSLIHI